jgi:hypothetical protein
MLLCLLLSVAHLGRLTNAYVDSIYNIMIKE